MIYDYLNSSYMWQTDPHAYALPWSSGGTFDLFLTIEYDKGNGCDSHDYIIGVYLCACVLVRMCVSVPVYMLVCP